jgi:hypothetical protein
MMEIVLTPTEGWLRKSLSECKSRFIAVSPFVTGAFTEITSLVKSSAETTLITRVNLKDFALGSSDVEAVCEMARRGTAVNSLPRLHAKVYIIDRRLALVTSANATTSGLRRNLECGVFLDDAALVCTLEDTALAGFGGIEEPVLWTLEELEELRAPVERVREMLPTQRKLDDLDQVVLKTPPGERKRVLSSFTGWTSLVLEGILNQVGDIYTLDDLFISCEPLAEKRYPNNRHVRAKLRQQLQRLRDLGLVEFLGHGSYKRLITTQEDRC